MILHVCYFINIHNAMAQMIAIMILANFPTEISMEWPALLEEILLVVGQARVVWLEGIVELEKIVSLDEDD